MTKRLKELFALLPKCQVFADIGCDHGYVAKAMLESGKCQKAILSDISEKCLNKAQELLKDDILDGRAIAVVSDGFQNLPQVELALIAGMGGEEIVHILSNAKTLPESLVLQPMKNSTKVRATLLDLGYAVQKDYTFSCGKIFYDVILAKKGKDFLTGEELEFGRTNLQEKPKAFIDYLKLQISNLTTFANGKSVKEETKKEMLSKAEKLKKYVDDK